MPATLFKYPDIMERELRAAGTPLLSEGRDCPKLSDAIKHANKLAEEKGLPIEITFLGSTRVVYPPELKEMGY